MHLGEATSSGLAALEAETDVALLPIGSTEQHGPHAPLGTDFLTAETVASEASEAFDGELLVAPSIPVGIAAEHRQFAGTLWVSPETFRAYVRETVLSLGSHGFDQIVLLNGHGGNSDALAEVAAELTRTEDLSVVSFTWFEAAAVGNRSEMPEDMGHAGAVETSVLLHAQPALVRREELQRAGEQAAESWGIRASGTNLAVDTVEFSDNGVVGDPREASAARGEALLETATDALLELIDALENRSEQSS